jgi:adenosine kinase
MANVFSTESAQIKKNILVSGSVAYDYLLEFPGVFRDSLVADNLNHLSVSFFAPVMRREYGGCAGNIAYNIQLLGDMAIPIAAVGNDSQGYLTRFLEMGVDCSCLQTLNAHYTAQAFITTDQQNNQIAVFHPGAMLQAGEFDIPMSKTIDLAIVSPNDKAAMLRHASSLKQRNIPYLFDPGQALPILTKQDIELMMNGAVASIMNRYEMNLVAEKLGVPPEKLPEQCDVLIVTDAEEGSLVYQHNQVIHIPAIPVAKAVDPTGCGDAYRAGLLYGLARDWSWQESAQLGSVMGAVKVQERGGQNHVIQLSAALDLLKKHYA